MPLFIKDGMDRDIAAMLPGRHLCHCQAAKHRLISNCLHCGRIVCAQEGSGPCLFCGNLVCSEEEREILERGSRKSECLRCQLLDQESPGLKAAQEHKNRLLDYDRSAAKRTQVIDDELDYFATDTNTWLSPGERERLREREQELRKARHSSRLGRAIQLGLCRPSSVDRRRGTRLIICAAVQ